MNNQPEPCDYRLLRLTAVWFMLAGLLVLWVVQQDGGPADSEFHIRPREVPRPDISIGDGSEELVRMKPDGTVEFGPHYTLDEAARAFWQSIAHEAPNAVRRACFERLRRERQRENP